MRLTRLQKALWLAVAVAALGVAGLTIAGRDGPSDAARSSASAETLRADFELTDHRGMVQSDEDFRGRWMLVFFGFANCPDVCPMGLATMADVVDALGPRAADVQPLFVTVDPERDSLAALAEYVPRFHPSILGLSGTPEQIARTAETFAVYRERIEDPAAPDGYTMGHTSSILLFDPEGAFVRTYGSDEPSNEIAADLGARIDA